MTTLKEQLKDLLDLDPNDIGQHNMDLVIETLLDNIGSTDPELRDNIIYMLFLKLINNDLLTDEQIHHILDSCLDNQHLFYQISESNTDSVFTRSFSSLAIAAILYKDRQAKVLTKDTYEKVYGAALEYLVLEQDTLGYVQGKGWAHSIAHGADLILNIVLHPFFDGQNTEDILQVIATCICKNAEYADEEDERLITIIEVLIENDMSESLLYSWVEHQFNDLRLMYESTGYSDKYYRTKVNLTTFMKSLYFRLMFNNYNPISSQLIFNRLKELHQAL